MSELYFSDVTDIWLFPTAYSYSRMNSLIIPFREITLQTNRPPRCFAHRRSLVFTNTVRSDQLSVSGSSDVRSGFIGPGPSSSGGYASCRTAGRVRWRGVAGSVGIKRYGATQLLRSSTTRMRLVLHSVALLAERNRTPTGSRPAGSTTASGPAGEPTLPASANTERTNCWTSRGCSAWSIPPEPAPDEGSYLEPRLVQETGSVLESVLRSSRHENPA
jgi:hypothetical protein